MIRRYFIPTIVATVAACSHAGTQTTQSYLGPHMAPPDHVYVAYFSIAPDQVRLDQGIGARLQRAAGNQPADSLASKVAHDTQAALAERIADRLRTYGLPAVVGDYPANSRNDLLIQGQIVAIDQGNRTRRVLIGLGAGKSSIAANTQIYRLTASAPPRFLAAFEGKGDSGRMPGAVETMGAGAVAQRAVASTALTGAAHASGETRHASDSAGAKALGDEIAGRVAQLAVSQGWIAQKAAQ